MVESASSGAGGWRPGAADGTRPLVHFGTFDIENYGDLLFPLILERRLEDLCDEFVHVSPVGGDGPWGDCRPTVSAEAALGGPRPRAVIFGGGHTLHSSPAGVSEYTSPPRRSLVAYPGLWLTAGVLAAQGDVPLAWNAPGVPRPLPPGDVELVKWLASVSDHLSVRDDPSRRLLEAGIGHDAVHVVPDTALDVSRLWGEGELAEAAERALGRHGGEVPDRHLALHLNARYVDERPEDLAARLDRMALSTRARPVLLALGPCHGDDRFATEIAGHMRSAPIVVASPQSLREVAGIIASAQAYVGSSLHGMITACAFGTRAAVVASEERAGFAKFSGFLEQFDLSRWLIESWRLAEDRLGSLLEAPRTDWERVSVLAQPRLDEHWNKIRRLLVEGQEGGDRAARTSKTGALARLESLAQRPVEEQILGQVVERQAEGLVEGLSAAREKARERGQDVVRLQAQLWRERGAAFAAQLLELEEAVDALARSSPWRLGQRLVGVVRALALRPSQEVGTPVTAARDHVRTLGRLGERLEAGREAEAVLASVVRELHALDRHLERVARSPSWRYGHRLITTGHRLTLRRANGAGEVLARTRTRLDSLERLVARLGESERFPLAGSRELTTIAASPDAAPHLAGATGVEPRPARPAASAVRRAPGGAKKELKVSLICWDMGHNPITRANLLAEMLDASFEVEIVGTQFPRYGNDIWAPLRDSPLSKRTFPGRDFPEYFEIMERAARSVDGDVLYACKPRLPSLGLGLLAKEHGNKPLLLDSDDYEPAFFNERHGLTLEELRHMQDDPDFRVPFGRLWTRLCDSVVRSADHVTVSNPALRERFGGTVVPHARDEQLFNPHLYDRREVRASLGFEDHQKLVLFAGTPRAHKGLQAVAEALERIGNPDYKLCVIGTVGDKYLRKHLERFGDLIRLIPYQPFTEMARILTLGDLICVLQDPDSLISQYQVPAKVTDALAMEIPCLVTRTPPLEHFISNGAVHVLDERPLDETLKALLDDYDQTKAQAVLSRDLFLSHYSYAAVRPRLETAIRRLVEAPSPLAPEHEQLLRFQRDAFASGSGGDGAIRGGASKSGERR